MDWFDQNAPAVTTPGQAGAAVSPDLANFEQNYRAPDRDQVLAQMRQAQPVQGAPSSGGYSGPQKGIDDFEREWMGSGGRTVDDLKNFVASHPEYGVKLGGSKGDKIYGPNGEFWADGVISAGLGGRGATFDRGTGGGAAGGGAMSGAYLTPYGEQYKLPTAEELKSMPGYEAAQAAALQAVDRGAAAHGTLLTGGTLKAEQDRAGEVADRMYAQLAGLKLNEQGFNRDTFYHNQDAPFSKLFQTSQLGLQAAGQQGNMASSYSQNAQQNATNVGNAQAAGTAGQANATTGAIAGLANTGLSAFNDWLARRGGKAA
jgi:hypothetical protein